MAETREEDEKCLLLRLPYGGGGGGLEWAGQMGLGRKTCLTNLLLLPVPTLQARRGHPREDGAACCPAGRRE